MGKGDKKTKRGKIILGSSGVRRPKNKKKNVPTVVAQKPVKEMAEPKPAKKVKEETVAAAKPVKKAKEKVAETKPAKKATTKKAKE